MSEQPQAHAAPRRQRGPKPSVGCLLIAAAFLVLTLGSFGVSVATGQAHLPTWIGGDGDPDDIRVSSIDADYTIRPNGSVHVVRTLKYDFNDVKRHGPTVNLAERGYEDSEHDIVYGVQNLKVSSPTGAPAGYTSERDEDGRTLTLRVGDQDEKVTGRQTYVVSYDTASLEDADILGIRFDEEVVDYDLDAPIAKVTGRISAPAPAEDADCGDGCDARVDADGTVSLTSGAVERDESLSLSANYSEDAGSAIDVPEQKLVPSGDERHRAQENTADWWAWALAALFAAIGLARLLQVLAFRLDQRRLGRTDDGPRLVDGTVVHAAGQPLTEPFPTGVTLDDGRTLDLPGVAPALAGAVLRRRADRSQGIATLLDLAVRGYVEIVDHVGDQRVPATLRWTVRPRAGMDTSGLASHEAALLAALGSRGTAVPRDGGPLSRAYAAVTTPLGSAVSEAGWLRRALPKQRGRWTWVWAVVLVGFAALMLWLNLRFGLGNAQVCTLGGLAGGALLIVAAYVGAGRRAAGAVVADRTEKLRDRLGAAAADRLRYRDGVDLYGGFLPWAVLFGQEARWLDTCDQLAQAGRLPPPPWYAGHDVVGVGLSTGSSLRAFVAALRKAHPERSAGVVGRSTTFSSSSSSSGGGGGSSGGSW